MTTVGEFHGWLEESYLATTCFGVTHEFSAAEYNRLAKEVADALRRDMNLGAQKIGTLAPDAAFTKSVEVCFQRLRDYVSDKINVVGG